MSKQCHCLTFYLKGNIYTHIYIVLVIFKYPFPTLELYVSIYKYVNIFLFAYLIVKFTVVSIII